MYGWYGKESAGGLQGPSKRALPGQNYQNKSPAPDVAGSNYQKSSPVPFERKIG